MNLWQQAQHTATKTQH